MNTTPNSLVVIPTWHVPPRLRPAEWKPKQLGAGRFIPMNSSQIIALRSGIPVPFLTSYWTLGGIPAPRLGDVRWVVEDISATPKGLIYDVDGCPVVKDGFYDALLWCRFQGANRVFEACVRWQVVVVAIEPSIGPMPACGVRSCWAIYEQLTRGVVVVSGVKP